MSDVVTTPAESATDRAHRFKIEQRAAKPQDYEGLALDPDEVQHSIAVSLTRIANMMESVIALGGGFGDTRKYIRTRSA